MGLYIQHTVTGEEECPEPVFLRGYIAVLLGLLIKDTPTNLAGVLATLRGESASEKLKSLIHHCRAFVDLYTQTIASTNSHGWEKSGVEVARNAITSLELLEI